MYAARRARRWTLFDLLAALGGAINLAVVGWIFLHWLLP